MHGSMRERKREPSVWIHVCVIACYAHFPQLQSEERARRHRAWPHADWLSSHPSKGIRGTDGAVLYPEEHQDDAGPRGR